MTQFSWNFACVPAAGDAGPLTAENLAAARLLLGSTNPQGAGVVYWSDDTPANILFPGAPPGLSANPLNGLLQPSVPAANTVRIASGVALVMGYLFVNDDDVDFDFESAPGEADATDLIVLRRDNLAVTPRVVLARKQATAPSSTAVLQQDGTIWEVALAEVLLDGSGELDDIINVSSLTAPAGTVMKIGAGTGTGANSSISFTNIPQVFSHLRLVGKCRSSAATSDVAIRLRLNGDTGSNYEFMSLITDSSPATTPGANLAADYLQIGFAPGATPAANHAGEIDILLPGCRDTFFKAAFSTNKYINSGAVRFLYTGQGAWRSTDAISDIEISFGGAGGNFVAGSAISLYGIV